MTWTHHRKDKTKVVAVAVGTTIDYRGFLCGFANEVVIVGGSRDNTLFISIFG